MQTAYRRSTPEHDPASGGFTLIELVMVLILVGVLAVAVMPRFFDRAVFDARGFQDETLAALRYAQKEAVAQRRTVCITFSSTGVTLTVAANAGTATCTPSVNLAGPNGTSPFSIASRSAAVKYQGVPANFSFNALGQPQPNTRQTIQIVGMASAITVEQDTGYVHQ
jgi:MSHA pilin protein MshC